MLLLNRSVFTAYLTTVSFVVAQVPPATWVAGPLGPLMPGCGIGMGKKIIIWTCVGPGPGNCVGHPVIGGNLQYTPGQMVQQIIPCPLFPCPGPWYYPFPWNVCSVSCGPMNSGTQERTRVCNPDGTDPCPADDGSPVEPGTEETQVRPCPEEDVPCPTPNPLDVLREADEDVVGLRELAKARRNFK